MTSMVMMDIIMEVSVNKALPLKGRTQAWLGHFWALLDTSSTFRLRKTFALLDFGLNLLKARNNKLDKCLI